MLPISDDMRVALTAAVQEWDFGVDLLNADGQFVEDISADVIDFQVTHDLYADVHGDCQLSLTRDLAWGADRIRPWVTVHGTEGWHRWNLGVFIPTSPDIDASEEPRTRDVRAYDILWMLQREIGDTYVIQSGVSYLDAIRTALDAAGVTVTLLLQGERQLTTLTEPAVWVLGGGYTWLDVINDLLGMIGYDHIWSDSEGRLRSAPYQPVSERGSVWVFDASDTLASIIAEQRRLSADVFDLPNLWRFIRNKDQPMTADDVYVVDRTGGLPAFQVRPKVVYVDAVDRAALVTEGDRIVTEDTAKARTVEFDSTPLPLEHGDIVEVRDPALLLSARCQVVISVVTPDSLHLTLEVL